MFMIGADSVSRHIRIILEKQMKLDGCPLKRKNIDSDGVFKSVAKLWPDKCKGEKWTRVDTAFQSCSDLNFKLVFAAHSLPFGNTGCSLHLNPSEVLYELYTSLNSLQNKTIFIYAGIGFHYNAANPKVFIRQMKTMDFYAKKIHASRPDIRFFFKMPNFFYLTGKFSSRLVSNYVSFSQRKVTKNLLSKFWKIIDPWNLSLTRRDQLRPNDVHAYGNLDYKIYELFLQQLF